MNNSDIRQFRDSIIAMINAAPLPIEVKRMTLSEIYNAVNAEAERVILEEKNTKEKDTENGEKHKGGN